VSLVFCSRNVSPLVFQLTGKCACLHSWPSQHNNKVIPLSLSFYPSRLPLYFIPRRCRRDSLYCEFLGRYGLSKRTLISLVVPRNSVSLVKPRSARGAVFRRFTVSSGPQAEFSPMRRFATHSALSLWMVSSTLGDCRHSRAPHGSPLAPSVPSHC